MSAVKTAKNEFGVDVTPAAIYEIATEYNKNAEAKNRRRSALRTRQREWWGRLL